MRRSTYFKRVLQPAVRSYFILHDGLLNYVITLPSKIKYYPTPPLVIETLLHVHIPKRKKKLLVCLLLDMCMRTDLNNKNATNIRTIVQIKTKRTEYFFYAIRWWRRNKSEEIVRNRNSGKH